MAAKLILMVDGASAQEYPLTKERMTIGRKKHNDIVIDNLAVSGEHAAVVTIMHDSFLEDLDSTNGVEVNGARCKKHFLQHNDVIEIGRYKLKYVTDRVTQMSAEDNERTMLLSSVVNKPASFTAAKPVQVPSVAITQTNITRLVEDEGQNTGKFHVPGHALPPAQPAPAPLAPAMSAGVASTTGRVAAVQILSGPNAGKELELVKSLTTLGKPGTQVAVLTRRPHGFFITHVEGEKFPLVNGRAISNQPHQLNDNDLIELAGIKMEFYFKN